MTANRNVIIGCPQCGVSVFQHQGQRYTPVREYLLTGQLIGRDRGEDVQFRRAYVKHQCLPEDLGKHSELTESIVTALEKIIEDNPPQWLQQDLRDASNAATTMREKLQEVTLRSGLVRQCPRCQADIGMPCENLTERKRGNSVPTKHPHDERLPLVDTVEGTELKLAGEKAADAYGLLFEIQEALKAENALEKLLRLAEGL